jgi:hypothetical protein
LYCKGLGVLKPPQNFRHTQTKFGFWQLFVVCLPCFNQFPNPKSYQTKPAQPGKPCQQWQGFYYFEIKKLKKASIEAFLFG